LESVSVHPALFRIAAVVFERVAVGAVSEQVAAVPKPTTSWVPVVGQTVPVVIVV
jgi:hypothetical protein